MSITPTTNFMSNEYILGWMETKTDGIYGKMRTAMDSSDDRAHAEEVLNSIKSKIADAAANHTDGKLLRADLEDAIHKYGAEFPELKKTLQPILDELNQRAAKNEAAARTIHIPYLTRGQLSFHLPAPAPVTPDPVSISQGDSDRWGKSIDGQVEAFGKTDQLSMINIQEFNAQLNQAKQTASALMDAADKSQSSIINHIS